MKKVLINVSFLAVLLLVFGAQVAYCQIQPNPAVVIVVDEYGVGTITITFPGAPTNSYPLSGILQQDPGPGGLTSVLTYDLLGPPLLVEGDVLLTEPDSGGATLDVIRFNNLTIDPASIWGTTNPIMASLLFYSDNVDGFDAPADTPGPPGSFYTNVASINEIGPEGNNYASYTPAAGQPGFVAGYDVSYTFISDTPVPEPATMLLLGSGLIGLAGYGRKKFFKK